MVDPELLDFLSDSDDIIGVFPDSDDEEFMEFEPVMEVELVLNIIVS
jgi:hypothetical protein